MIRLSMTLSSVSRLSSWGTTPRRDRMEGPSLAGSWPSTRSSPLVADDTQPIIRMVELLPAPFGPRNPNTSPGRTSKSMPSTAMKSSNRLESERATTRGPEVFTVRDASQAVRAGRCHYPGVGCPTLGALSDAVPDRTDASDATDESTPSAALAAAWRRPMRGRSRDEEHRASTPLELFFDLCFVIGVSQAASELAYAFGHDHSSGAVFSYAVVFFAIWWAWMNFTWFASAYDTDDVPYRLLTLLQIV